MSNLTSAIQLTKDSRYKLNNGQSIPVAGFGVYEIPKEDTADLVYYALSVGYRHIDSAIYYKNQRESSEGIARFLKDHPEVERKDIWFTTKIRFEDHGYENTKKAIELIAKEVKEYIGYVDLVLIHSPHSNPQKRIESWKALQEYVLEPNNPTLDIKSIGVSNYGKRHLQELFDWDGFVIKPVVDQIELHPWLPRLELREFLVEHDIWAEAYSPLTQGVKLDDPELLEWEKKYKLPKGNILLTWSYLQGFIVIAKSAKKERIKLNLDVLPDGNSDELGEQHSFGKIELDPELLLALDKPKSHDVCTWNGVDPTLYEP
ncbi:hypothetical protein QFC19_003204 [Naganishia cerealis]|uniref:Uncharacterized protein n=1 Tax=Naganishia cerealis TaxID=610337 RepID=A0ACC2W5F3_9TREE|nr:hypothetical protein QFC19_003204 [Naganishia cerealis]